MSMSVLYLYNKPKTLEKITLLFKSLQLNYLSFVFKA